MKSAHLKTLASGKGLCVHMISVVIITSQDWVKPTFSDSPIAIVNPLLPNPPQNALSQGFLNLLQTKPGLPVRQPKLVLAENARTTDFQLGLTS